MTEEIENTQEEVKEIVAPNEESQASESAVTEKKQLTDKEINFAELRKQLKQRDEYIQNMEREINNIKSEFAKSREPQQPVEPELDPDDFATSRHVISKAKKIAQEEIAQAREEERQRNFKSEARNMHPDFDSVVTTENLQRLESEMPEIAKIIGESTDRVKMASGAYKAIKVLLKQDSVEKEVENNKKALESNKTQPLSAAAVDRRPIAQAARLTDADYQKLWQETQYYASKVN